MKLCSSTICAHSKASGIEITDHNQPIELDKEHRLNQRLDYIHYNPVVAGIVRYPEQYHNSAGNYARLKDNLLEVMLI